MPKRRLEHGSVEAEVPAAGLISLTDVMGSLVKVFALTIPFVIESGIFVSRSMAAKLNRPIQQKQVKTDVKVSIHMRADGTIELNKKPVTQEQLEDLVPKLLARSIEKNAL
ncbi:MAG: biopolymer transporter ExbD, partial [candidate division WOR-3 bacterium]